MLVNSFAVTDTWSGAHVNNFVVSCAGEQLRDGAQVNSVVVWLQMNGFVVCAGERFGAGVQDNTWVV